MKIQLDTTNKKITLFSNEKFNDVVNALEKLLPNGEWKEFILETNTYINNWKPIYIYPQKQWWEYPYITWNNGTPINAGLTYTSSNSNNYSLNNGTYQLEI